MGHIHSLYMTSAKPHHAEIPLPKRQVRCFGLPYNMAGGSANVWLADLTRRFDDEPADCVLDMAGTQHLDAHGFRVLLAALDHVREAGHRMVLVEPHPRVRRLLERLCMHQEINVFNTLSTAFTYLYKC